MKVGILSDSHDNLASLRQALDILEKEKVDQSFMLETMLPLLSRTFNSLFYPLGGYWAITTERYWAFSEIRREGKCSFLGGERIVSASGFPILFAGN